MKKLIYFIFTIMIFTFTTFYVHANCTDEEISSLKKEAEKIKVTYKHLGAVEVEGGAIEYSHFNLTFTNLNNYMYLKDDYNNVIKADNNSDTIILESQTGSYKYSIFSEKCDVPLKILNIVLPKFNIYSLDPLCEGIDGDDFALCGKYYNSNISYETFMKKITDYKKKNNINSDNDLDEDKSIAYYLKSIYDYIFNNLIYFVYGLAISLILIVLTIIIKKKKNRGVLK